MSLTEVILGEIERGGPLAFSRFMELALYHPQLGYYRRGRDPFGREGDFFTSSQLQPVFGRLIAQQIDRWRTELGSPVDFSVIELGPGRGETSSVARGCLPGVRWLSVDVGDDWPTKPITGVAFSNEFFDALPVDLYERSDRGWREWRVGWDGRGFAWIPSLEVEYQAALPDCPSGQRIERCSAATSYLDKLNGVFDRGFILTIDYGYTHNEIVRGGRFLEGSLMGYKSHQSDPDVLADPGDRDITAHVDFTNLIEHGASIGWSNQGLSTQQEFLAGIGEQDNFRYALSAETDDAATRLRMQLKTLLFGMGETFRVLVQRKG